MNDETGGRDGDGLGDAVPPERLSWTLDPDRLLLMVVGRGGICDDDLLNRAPLIWEQRADIDRFAVVVDVRNTTREGGWTWQALREVARRWDAYAPYPRRGQKVAIVTRNHWIAMLSKTFVHIFPGLRFRCFSECDEAIDWATAP